MRLESFTVRGVTVELVRQKPTAEGSQPLSTRPERPAVILLHEGLGSARQWRDFPRLLADRLGTEVIAYSRAGHGGSGPAPAPWPVSFMHREGREVLPELIEALSLSAPPVLFGHSDGGSIALICAGVTATPLSALVVMAPHVFVEPITVRSIEELGEAWRDEEFRRRFSFYHRDGSALFAAWREVWLSPEFRKWNIESLLPSADLPILAIQGEQDAYGTMAQIEAIAEKAPRACLLRLEECGHSPHRDRTGTVLDAIAEFFSALGQSR